MKFGLITKYLKMNKVKLFKKLGEFNENGESRVVSTSEFIGEYSSLAFGNGGSWCRFDGTFAKEYKIVTVNRRDIRYSWSDISDEEKSRIEEDFLDKDRNNNGILYIKSYGKQEKDNCLTRRISEHIKNEFKNQPCVVCGSKNDIIIDHKNQLYNDSRVLNIKTQRLDDFQSLCNHCNLQKRQVTIIMNKTKKRYSAYNIPSLRHLDIEFTSGNSDYDENDPNWGIGTYWYDPVEFIKQCKIILQAQTQSH